MDVFSDNWLTEMELEGIDPTFINQYGSPMQSFGESLDEFDFESISSENFSSYPSNSSSNPKRSASTPNLSDSTFENFQAGGGGGGGGLEEKPSKQLKTNNGKFCFCPTGPKTPEASSSSSSCLISFGNSDVKPIPDDTLTFYGNLNWEGKPNDKAAVSNGNVKLEYLIPPQNEYHSVAYGQGTKRLSSTRNPLQNQEHVIAERKRREKLNHQFIALSAIIPGLKKTDKASVLGDAVNYLKQLQERVKMLEEGQTAKKMVESVVTVKRHQLSDNETSSSSSYHSSDSSSNQPLLDIEARVSNKDVLIRIHCEKKKGLAVKILGEIEKLHLTVINSSCMPFGECIMDMTIVAQMDYGFCTTAKDVVQNLQRDLVPFM